LKLQTNIISYNKLF